MISNVQGAVRAWSWLVVAAAAVTGCQRHAPRPLPPTVSAATPRAQSDPPGDHGGGQLVETREGHRPGEDAPAGPDAPAADDDAAPRPGGPSAPPGGTGAVAAEEGIDVALPPPSGAWALAAAPALAHHSQDAAASKEALERFRGWFRGKGPGPHTIYFFDGSECVPVRGQPGEDGFFGRYRETVTTDGNTRRSSGYSFDVGRHGITESGPGGVILERDARGRWQEVGGFGAGCFEVLEHNAMSRVERGVAYFGGYRYGLRAICDGMLREQQRCEGGGTRVCERCSGVGLKPFAPNRGWGQGRRVMGRPAEPPRVDCSKPCPADEVTSTLEPLNRFLRGKTFYGEGVEPHGVLFRSARSCRRTARRQRAR